MSTQTLRDLLNVSKSRRPDSNARGLSQSHVPLPYKVYISVLIPSFEVSTVIIPTLPMTTLRLRKVK